MIFLLHIPKTGGQTLSARIASAYPPGRCNIMVPRIESAADLADQMTRYDFLAGHPVWQVLEHPPRGLDVMALVRDPVEQIVSQYRHIRRDPGNPLHGAAAALPPRGFIERFANHMFNFQARAFVGASRRPTWAERVAADEMWMVRNIESAVAQIRWLVPTEQSDEFCALWTLEAGRPLGQPRIRLNEVGADGVDAPALRDWLRQRPERFALDSLLWTIARRRYAMWRDTLITCNPNTGDAAAGVQAWSVDDGAVWLVRDWHPPERAEDGTVVWWAGPGVSSRVRLRRGGRQVMRFKGIVFLGMHWNQIRLFREIDMTEMPLRRGLDTTTQQVSFETDIGHLGRDEILVLHGTEDATALPAVALALDTPRRGYATRDWCLA